jgi:type VI secretion system protein ImpB
MAESRQHTLDRVRSPRVQITYDVETGGATETKEIPFVVGVMADLSGKPKEKLPPIKKRKFTEIDRDNFDKVLKAATPRVAFRVDDKLSGDEDSQIAVEINFNSLDDFHPENVAKQIDPLAKLLETRRKLSDLLTKLDGNDKLDELLQEVISNTDILDKVGTETKPTDET